MGGAFLLLFGQNLALPPSPPAPAPVPAGGPGGGGAFSFSRQPNLGGSMGLFLTSAFWREFLRSEGEPAALLSDTFTDANNMPLPAHAMDNGRGWNAGLGSWQIQTNKAVPITVDGATQAASVFTESGFSDVTVSCDINSLAANGGGILIRRTDTANAILLFADRAAGAVKIISIVAGVKTTLATAAVVFVNGTVVTLSGTARGGTITATIGGVTATAVGVAFNAGATQVGLYALQQTALDHTFDNFTVSKFGNYLSEVYVRLITNVPPLTPNLKWSDLAEATFNGYAPLGPIAWLPPLSDGGGVNILPGNAFVSIATDGALPNVITGYALVSGAEGAGGPVLYGVELFRAAVGVGQLGAGLALWPALSLACDQTALPGANVMV